MMGETGGRALVFYHRTSNTPRILELGMYIIYMYVYRVSMSSGTYMNELVTVVSTSI